MLIEVAKRQYLAAHPDRQRTPKGFTKRLELHLTAVEEGSAIPVIALVFATLFPSADADYFAQAKDQIVEAIAAAERGQQPALPPELLRYFDRFGRGLQDGEAMEFARSNGQTASLTPTTRERLLRASQAESWTEEVTLKGRIPEVDQADHSFELELRDGTKLKAPLLELHLKTVLDAAVGYRDGTLVAIKGVIQRDRADRRKGFESVEHITPLDPLDIETRLEELAQLRDGWLDGKGRAPERAALLRLAQAFDEHYAPDLQLPYLYPAAEGGVQAEWTRAVDAAKVNVMLQTRPASQPFLTWLLVVGGALVVLAFYLGYVLLNQNAIARDKVEATTIALFATQIATLQPTLPPPTRLATATPTLVPRPNSCAMLKEQQPRAEVGPQTIYLQGKTAVTLYCHNMSTTPQEFLTLPATANGANYSVTSYPERAIITQYEKVCLNPTSLIIDATAR